MKETIYLTRKDYGKFRHHLLRKKYKESSNQIGPGGMVWKNFDKRSVRIQVDFKEKETVMVRGIHLYEHSNIDLEKIVNQFKKGEK